MVDKQEALIQEEIRRRVIEAEEQKLQGDRDIANREALAEITSLSREEVDQIAAKVRSEHAQKQMRFRKNVVAVGAVTVIWFLLMGVALIFQYNTIIRLDEQVKTKWSQVENVYQRRFDLIPNLVKTVQAYAQHEKTLFQMVTQARSKTGGMLNLSDEIFSNPELFKKFQATQNELSHLLKRTLVVAEQNPASRGDQNFLALQAQLEGTENRIAVERKRFNEAVQKYNAYIKKFPQTMIAGMLGFNELSYFKSEAGTETPPTVHFD